MSGELFVALKDLCNNYKEDIVDGPFGANLKREHYQEDGVPVLKIQNIKPFKITLKKMDFVSQAKSEELKRHSYAQGDIIMTKLGDPLGESAIVDGIEDGIIVADLVRIRAQKIDTKYLCYHLNSPVTNEYINSQQKGTTRPRVRISVVRELPIFTPPIPEQKRIVAILDEAFANIDRARELTERNLKNARELFDSYLNQIFTQKGEGWVEKSMGKLFKIKHGYAFKSAQFETDFEGDNPIVLTPGNYTETGSLYFNKKNTKRCISSFPDDFLFNEGDLTIVMTDLSSHMKILGKPAFIGKEKTLHNQRIGKFEYLSDEVLPEFLYWFLLSNSSLDNIKTTATGTTVRHTAPARILGNTINYPESKNQQFEISSRLEEVCVKTDEMVDVYLNKLNELIELKKSILQKAFSGELTASDAESGVA